MPFRIEDGKAFGPGVFDMKAGIVQGLFALLALRELRRDIRCKIVFLMTSDEEIGSHTSRALIEAEAARSRCVLVLEPAAGPQGALKTSRKGTGTFRIDVKGVSAHAGLEPEKGRSAIEELSRQIVHLHGMSNAERGITLNVGRIKGGTASNVVAPSASALLDLRIQKLADADEVLPRILGIQPFLEGTRLTVQGELNRPPLERSEQVVALYQRACRIAQSEMSFELPETAVGGASDGNFTAPFAPTLDGLGAVGDGAHANHEHIVIEELPRRSALLARLIEELSQEPYEPQHPPSEQ
jgi:glutamate carboxypeptidase